VKDQRNKLAALFQSDNRYDNFGEAIIRMHVSGFRCHEKTIIDVESPITAFCGLNGTGKSTLLQLAAAAYKNPPGHQRRYVNNFIIAGKLDSAPFTANASVKYEYLQAKATDGTTQTKAVTVSRGQSKWTGYKRQPERRSYFAGVGLYLPRIEELDSATRHARTLSIQDTVALTVEVKDKISQILGTAYDSAEENHCKIKAKSQKVVTVGRNAVAYSELNMGCGEGRIYHIVRVLEDLPDRSVVLLEEPETSLHPSAQHNFGRYLVDVCVRKRHQVFLTTHSEYLLKALPSSSRIYIDRLPTGQIRLISGITTAQALSLMTEGHTKALIVLVEDDVAGVVLAEIVRRVNPTFLKTIGICSTGDTKTIHNVMMALAESGLPVAAVRDGDKGGQAKQNIFKLPGTFPPEKEILANGNVQAHVLETYGVDLPKFLALSPDLDHHEWFGRLSDALAVDENALVHETAKVYARSLPETEVDSLVEQLKEAVQK
jgi:predicted ATPase